MFGVRMLGNGDDGMGILGTGSVAPSLAWLWLLLSLPRGFSQGAVPGSGSPRSLHCMAAGWGLLLCPGLRCQGSFQGAGAPSLPGASTGAEHTPYAGVVAPGSPAITPGLCLSPAVKQARLSCPETQSCWQLHHSHCPRPASAGAGSPESGLGTPRGWAEGKWDPWHRTARASGVWHRHPAGPAPAAAGPGGSWQEEQNCGGGAGRTRTGSSAPG